MFVSAKTTSRMHACLHVCVCVCVPACVCVCACMCVCVCACMHHDEMQERYNDNIHAVQSGLYDTLAVAYLEGYHQSRHGTAGAGVAVEYDSHKHKGGAVLLQLAVIVMAHYVA